MRRYSHSDDTPAINRWLEENVQPWQVVGCRGGGSRLIDANKIGTKLALRSDGILGRADGQDLVFQRSPIRLVRWMQEHDYGAVFNPHHPKHEPAC